MRTTTGWRRLVVVLGSLGLGWFAVVVVGSLIGEQHALGPVGDALAPLGTILTAVALGFAFAQRHEDAERAHKDQLVAAYTVWFNRTWRLVGDCIDEFERALGQGPHAVGDFKNAITTSYSRERDLYLAAIPPLMLERDPSFSERLRKTQTAFARWPLPDPQTPSEVKDYRAFANGMAAE